MDKLKAIPADLSKRSKRSVYDKLVKKVNATDTKVTSTNG